MGEELVTHFVTKIVFFAILCTKSRMHPSRLIKGDMCHRYVYEYKVKKYHFG